jgi:hypothetical protein
MRAQAIPLQFREWGNHRDGYSDGEIWDRYIWEGPVVGLDPYTDTDREDSRASFIPGIGCTVNSAYVRKYPGVFYYNPTILSNSHAFGLLVQLTQSISCYVLCRLDMRNVDR